PSERQSGVVEKAENGRGSGTKPICCRIWLSNARRSASVSDARRFICAWLVYLAPKARAHRESATGRIRRGEPGKAPQDSRNLKNRSAESAIHFSRSRRIDRRFQRLVFTTIGSLARCARLT